MVIPKTHIYNNKEYTFVKQCNNNLFLYQCEDWDRHCFTKYDLGLVKKLDIIKHKRMKEYAKEYLKGDEGEWLNLH